ncbi:MAG: tetratricopeptide repeat-containing sensor histidine kinase, partial [Ekhidna sp.]
ILLLHDLDSTRMEMMAFNTLGRLYWLSGDPEKSTEAVYKVAELAQEIEDQVWEAIAYTNLASSLKSQKEYDKALSIEKKALKIYANEKDSVQQFLINSNLLETYYNLGMYDSAMWAGKRSITFITDVENPNNIYVSHMLNANLALLLARKEKYDSAKILISRSSEYFVSRGDITSEQTVAVGEIELAKIFLESGQLDDAIFYAQRGFNIGQKNLMKEVIRDGADVLAHAYEVRKENEKSLSYYKTYYAYRDSITNVENVKQIESLRADFEINQKQTELDIVEVQRRDQEIISYITAGILLIILVLASIIYRSYRQKNALSNELAMINESKNKLFSIISHDLRGPMAAFSGVGFMIKTAMQTDDKSFLNEVAEEVDKSSKQLSSLLDNLLNWSMQQQDGLIVNHDKIESKQMLLELKDTFESQSKLKNITIETEDVQDCMIKADQNMAYTIFRNLISNALKFTSENGKISITCKSENDNVMISIKDTGVGMPKEKVDSLFKFDSDKSTFGTVGEKGLGLGLQLVNDFVEMNNGAIEVESEMGVGTTFIVGLPAASEE